MANRIKRWLLNKLQEHFVILFLTTIVFILGIIFGAITIKLLDANQRNEMMSFFNSFFKSIDKSNFTNFTILKQSLIDNFKTVGLIWILGIVFIGIPLIPAIVLFRGFAIGFTVGFLVNEYGAKGFAFSILGILPQNLFIIPGIISTASIGLTFSIKNIKMRKFRLIHNNFFTRVLDYTIMLYLFSIIIFLGSIIEGYSSPFFLRMLTDYLG